MATRHIYMNYVRAEALNHLWIVEVHDVLCLLLWSNVCHFFVRLVEHLAPIHDETLFTACLEWLLLLVDQSVSWIILAFHWLSVRTSTLCRLQPCSLLLGSSTLPVRVLPLIVEALATIVPPIRSYSILSVLASARSSITHSAHRFDIIVLRLRSLLLLRLIPRAATKLFRRYTVRLAWTCTWKGTRRAIRSVGCPSILCSLCLTGGTLDPLDGGLWPV